MRKLSKRAAFRVQFFYSFFLDENDEKLVRQKIKLLLCLNPASSISL
jgi:hypothetical protein